MSQQAGMQVSKANTVRGTDGWHTSWLPRIESVMNWMLNYCLHAIILLVVIASPDIWSSPVYYLLACNGMLYTNYVNLRSMWSSTQGAWLRKNLRGAVPDVGKLVKSM